jgi:fructose-1,6-bisphosphatase/inositol monophosphatase family enzyme
MYNFNMTEHFTNKVLSIVREAGEMIKPHFGRVVAIDQKGIEASTTVTEVDRQVESMLADRLGDLDSSIGFVGEEFGGNSNTERYWLVDPIDGTGHFIRGIPFCTIMIALVESGTVVFSAIYDFMNGQMYSARKADGAKLNGSLIRVSNRSLSQSYLFHEINLDKNDNLAKFLELKKRTVLMKTINCGYEFCLIASGKIEGRLCIDPYESIWDYAPGAFLVAEAGGIVTNLFSDTYDFHNLNFVATNKQIYSELRSIGLV